MKRRIQNQEKTSLRNRIDGKIATLKSLENDLPSVVIVHDLSTNSVQYMSQRGLDILGVSMEELTAMGADYHPRFFNMEFAESYVPKILGLLERNRDEEVISYVQQVRSTGTETWTWYLSSSKIFMRDDEGKPLLVITTALPVAPELYIDAAKAERLMEENAFLRKHHHLFHRLTKREKEVLRMMTLGYNAAKIAKQLFISEDTARTHRRNVRTKLGVKNSYDITRYAQAFNLV